MRDLKETWNGSRPRLVVVSNRLPVVLKKHEGKWNYVPGSGGLVTALGPVLKDRGGIWIGWPGTWEHIDIEAARQLLGPASEESGYRLFPVCLTPEDLENYYEGFANAIIWPLFHDLQTECLFKPAFWKAYLEVNRKFATSVKRHSSPGDFLWIHDYHLMGLAKALREMGSPRKTAFFLHIPFPTPDIFFKLPWRYEVMESLLEYHFLAFQTMRDRQNFQACMKAFWPVSRVRGRGPVVEISMGDRTAHLGALPISIDFRHFEAVARSPQARDQAQLLRCSHPGRKIIFGVDRLDYTKGILHRLEAYAEALERFPELREKVTLIQLVVPSREGVESYVRLRQEIERTVSRINGRFTTANWVPLVFLFRSIPQAELAGFYQVADVGLVTPLKDGMNLVAKEYCACQVGEPGVLVLSEFAGAASELGQGALLVNPHDVERMAEVIREAVEMPLEQRKGRMKLLRRKIRRRDIFWWVDNFLRAATGKELRDFPADMLAPPFGRSPRRETSGESTAPPPQA